MPRSAVVSSDKTKVCTVQGRFNFSKVPKSVPFQTFYAAHPRLAHTRDGQKLKAPLVNHNTQCKLVYLYLILGVNTDRKNGVGKVCSPKNFFDFLSPVKVRNFGNILIYTCKFNFFSSTFFRFKVK